MLIRIEVPLLLAATRFTMIDHTIECLVNVIIISLLILLSRMCDGKRMIIVSLIILLTLNTIYDVFVDRLLWPKERFYFQSPTKQVTLLVEVDKGGHFCGKAVDVYKQSFFILKEPVCMKEILIDSYDSISIEWHDDHEIILLVEHTEKECERIKIAYSK